MVFALFAVFRVKLPLFLPEGEAIKMENNNRKMAHIRRVTHIMMPAHRSCFNFAYFNSK